MIEETGIVTKVEGNMARVRVQKKGACEGCVAKGACETTPEGMEIDALNPVHAREGQTVQVSMGAKMYLKGSILVYGIPMIIFIAGAIIGKNVGEAYFRDISSDIVAAIAGFGALILSLVGVRIWSVKQEGSSESRPVIEKIIES